MKKLVSMLVVLAMVLSMIPAVFAAEGATSGTVDVVKNEEFTTDTWTAENDGVLTITLNSAEGVGYRVYCNGEAVGLAFDFAYEVELNYEVVAGDVYYVVVKGWNPDSWALCDATINWAYSFDADGVVRDPYAIVMDGEEAFVVSEMGDNQIPMVDTAEVTVVTFSPAEAGVYTITAGEGAAIGNCGSTSALINTDVEYGSSVEWTCEQAGYWTEMEIPAEDFQSSGEWITIEQYISGQSLMLGIVSDSDTVTIHVEKTGDYVAPVTTDVVYQNKAALAQFALPADATVGDYVNVYGDTHTAVMGNDGYYHLDSADGDILLVDMNYIAVLTDVLKSDRPVMYAYVTDADGNTTRYDIADAVLAYEAVCDGNGYYPLTEDLIFFYNVYAGGSGVFQFYLDEGFNPDCAWMFACLTMSLPQEEIPEGSGTEEDPYIITEFPYTIAVSYANEKQADAGTYYLYTPDKNGIISIQDFHDETNMGFLTEVEEWIHISETNELAVTAGTPVMLYHWNFWAGDYDLTLVFTETTDQPGEGGDGGDGGDEDDTPTETDTITEKTVWTATDVAVTPKAPVEISFVAGVNGTITVKDLSGNDCGWEFYIRSDYTDEEENVISIDTRLSSDEVAYRGDSMTETLVAGSECTITIYAYHETDWVWLEGEISYTVEFIPEGESGGDVEITGELTEGDNYLELPLKADEVSYAYTATQTGTLHFIVTEVGLDMFGEGDYEDDTDDIVNDFSYSTALTVAGKSLPYYYFGSIDVVEGETYIFTWTDINEYFDWGFDATLNLSYSDELLPKLGTEDLPVELHFEDCPTKSIEIPAEGRAHYTLIGFTGAHFTIKGVGAYAVVVTTEWNMETGEAKLVETTYKAENNVVTVPVTSHYFSVQIGNNATSAMTFTLDAEYPVGSWENPDTLTIGGNTAELAEGNEGYVFTWVAEKDGVLTITVDGKYWNYSVSNYGPDMEDYDDDVSGDWHMWAEDPAVASEEWEVKAGDIIVVTVSSYDPVNYNAPADTITVDASFVVGTDEDVVYGDVNGDGEIDILDANLIVAWYNEIRELDDDQLAAADVNGDGDVDIMDANMIVAYYNEIIDSFPAEQ